MWSVKPGTTKAESLDDVGDESRSWRFVGPSIFPPVGAVIAPDMVCLTPMNMAGNQIVNSRPHDSLAGRLKHLYAHSRDGHINVVVIAVDGFR